MFFLILIPFVVFFFPFMVLLIYDYVIYPRAYCKSKVCLLGKTALVTGCTGIGYYIILGLASRGCRVIIASRTEYPDLKDRIFKETHNANIDFKQVDFRSLKSVRELATAIVKSEKKIDILVHNAGVGNSKASKTDDGIDEVLQVNYFSHFLLTHLLIGLLKKSQSARIIFNSSMAAYTHDLTLENLWLRTDSEYSYHYCNSKICQIAFSDLLAEKLKPFKITSNCYHPGIVLTDIFRKAAKPKTKINFVWLFSRYLELGAFLAGKRPDDGAQTGIYLACANEVKDVTGKFFYETRETFKPWKLRDQKLCTDIWKLSEELVKLQPHEKL